MPAFLYQRSTNNGKLNRVRQISLAGSKGGAIHSLWLENKSPFYGWPKPITADNLIKNAIGSGDNVGDYEIIIDATPSLKSVIDLVKIVDIHVYTHKDTNGKASSSNLMLRVKDVCNDESVLPSVKAERSKSFQEKDNDSGYIVTFLYLRGYPTWNWGRLGQMNGAWIHPLVRDYFRSFF